MFLTSVVATFLTALSFNHATLQNSEELGGMAHVSLLATSSNLSNRVSVSYTGTNEYLEEYTTNVAYFYLNSNGLTYGYNGICNVSYTFSFTNVTQNWSVNSSYTMVEFTGTDDAMTINLSLYTHTPSDVYNINIYFTLLPEGEYSGIIEGGDSVAAWQDGYDTGYQERPTQTYTQGYNTGFTDARNIYENQDANINSIFRGILTIGLIPIEFFMSIFNFEVLGINFTHIISAILTLTIVVIILRMVLGGKNNG